MYSVHIVKHSTNMNTGDEIVTFEIVYPRFILAQLNTHRVISKSSASSRAVPVKKLIQMAKETPYIPETFGKNKSGMQSVEPIKDQQEARDAWLEARDKAVESAEQFMELGVHKQFANRVLEPFLWARTVLTATELDNFFKLRTHKDAQPEFRKIALLMEEALATSIPVELEVGQWHLPYVLPREHKVYNTNILKKISSARCARVSYRLHNGMPTSVIKDTVLAQELLDSGHMSPFDHPAKATRRSYDHGVTRQYRGFAPYRSEIEKTYGQ